MKYAAGTKVKRDENMRKHVFNALNFVKYYGAQVELYSKYWEEITKQKVKEAGLYFTSIDKWVKIYPNMQI